MDEVTFNLAAAKYVSMHTSVLDLFKLGATFTL